MNVLALGLDSNSLTFCKSVLGDASFAELSTAADFEKIFETPPPAELILCGGEITGLSLMELAQGTRGQYVSAPILFITQKRDGFEKKNLIKNGFNDAFLLPLDESFLKNVLEDAGAHLRKSKSFRPVKIVDLQPDEELGFDVRVLLPQNKKYLVYSQAGEQLSGDKVEKLKKHKVGSLYVAKEEMQKFYDYSANRLIALGKTDNQSMSETERTERLQAAVRDLFSNVVNTASETSTVEAGRELVKDAQSVVQSYITNSQPSDWYVKLQQTIGETQDSYSHTTNVSTFAAMFSIGLKIGKPEELAIAGMFHDLGLTDVPSPVLQKAESERTLDEKKLYEKHPDYSIDIIKARKLIVPQSVMTAIQQHHERWDGKGYPKQIHGERMTPEAKVLILADQFDYWTRVEPGKKRLSASEAIRKIHESGMLDPEFMYAAMKLIPKEESASTENG